MFVKLIDLVDKEFTVKEIGRYQYKKWDNENKKMLVSEKHEKGYSRKYPVETDKGSLDLGSGQLGNILEGVLKNGVSEPLGKTFSVKSNGKQGIEIRYYINPVFNKNTQETPVWDATREQMQQKAEEKNIKQAFDTAPTEISDEPVDLSAIPF